MNIQKYADKVNSISKPAVYAISIILLIVTATITVAAAGIVWSEDYHQCTIRSVEYHEGAVYTATDSCSSQEAALTSYDPDTNTFNWQSTGTISDVFVDYQNIAFDQDSVFVADYDGFFSVNKNNGAVEWEVDNDYRVTDIAHANNKVFVTDRDNNFIRSYDVSTQTQDWSHSLHTGAVRAVETNGNDVVYSADDDGVIIAYNSPNQAQEWSESFANYGTSVREMQYVNGTLYVAVGTYIVSYDTASNTVNWDISFGTDRPMDLEYKDGLIYAANFDSGDVHVFNPDNQQEVWSHSEHISSARSVTAYNGISVSGGGSNDAGDTQILAYQSDISTVSGTVTDQNNGSSLANITVTISNSTGVVKELQTDSNGQYSTTLNNGEYTIKADGTDQSYSTVSKDVNITSDTEVNFALEELVDELVVEIQKWMYPNTTQTYKGIYLPESGYTIVTSELNVTSSNTSVIAVNESTNELIAQPGVNDTANVTFQYKHLEVTKEMTVAHRTLEYIHILPSTQWAAAVLGLDDAGTEYGLGSEMQWIFVAIILSSLLSAISNNEWIGLGTSIITMVLLWILGNVGLGMVLATLFFGLFLALTLMEVPRNKNTEITVESNNYK